MMWLKIISLAALIGGTWSSFRAMGIPVRYEGRRYYRQPDGCYRRWYGGRSYASDEIGL